MVADAQRLGNTLVLFLGVDASSQPAYDSHEVVAALTNVGVTTFLGGLVLLKEEDINALTVPTSATGPEHDLNLGYKRKLVALVAMWHYAARSNNGAKVEPTLISKKTFGEYCLSKLRPKNAIVPYGIPLPASESTNADLATWKK